VQYETVPLLKVKVVWASDVASCRPVKSHRHFEGW